MLPRWQITEKYNSIEEPLLREVDDREKPEKLQLLGGRMRIIIIVYSIINNLKMLSLLQGKILLLSLKPS